MIICCVIDLTIDNEQMVVVYSENEEDNVAINMIDTSMISSVIKVFNFKHTVLIEFSVIKHRFIDSKMSIKYLSLKTDIFNLHFKYFNYTSKIFN